MKLLSEKELLWSPVVANANMNRGRNAAGINSYEKDVKLNPVKYLLAYIKAFGAARWLDLCCGEGRALIQTAIALYENNLQQEAVLTGIDLVPYFAPIPPGISCLDFLVQSIDNWLPVQKYDLITCVHGLHYTGDKLYAIQKALLTISDNGFFAANFDINSVYIDKENVTKYITGVFKVNEIKYNARTHIIECKGPREISFNVDYPGADDTAGRNYTGQEAVNAYYKITGKN